MRKTLSIILCAVMLLSVCSFAIPVSAAPEGTAINTADEFMAMVSTAADATEITAKYYLASDITLAGTYTEPFWGVLDGNGHTVTVTAPMFADFSGEVKNLNIKGEIFFQDANAAAFSTLSSKGFNATNCVNDANVTVTGTGKWAAGFVADCEYNEVPMVFTNCVNNGDIYVDSTADEKMRAGGFGGIIDSVILYNCTNTGDIYAKGNIPIIAGLVGRVALHAKSYTGEAYNCVNTGNIKVEDTYTSKDGVLHEGSGGSDAAGIFGYIGCKSQSGYYKVWGCRNDGDIDAPYRVGGMVAYTYGSGSGAYLDIQYCINTGDLTYGRTESYTAKTSTHETAVADWCSPMVAYTNSPYTTIKYNIDTGSITLREGAITNVPKTFFGCSGADATMYDLQGNYILNYEQFTHYSYASSESDAAQRHEITETDGVVKTTLKDIKSGKVCYEIMTLAGEDEYRACFDTDDHVAAGYEVGYLFAFYQKIGTDDYPNTNSESGWVVLNNGVYANGEKPADEVTTEESKEDEQTTEAPDNGTDAPVDGTDAPVDGTDAPAQGTDASTTTDKKSSCGGFVAGGVAIIAILGTALIAKKRD